MFRLLLNISPEGLERIKRSLQVHLALANDAVVQSWERTDRNVQARGAVAAGGNATVAELAEQQRQVENVESGKSMASRTTMLSALTRGVSRRCVLYRQKLQEEGIKKRWMAEDRKHAALVPSPPPPQPAARERKGSHKSQGLSLMMNAEARKKKADEERRKKEEAEEDELTAEQLLSIRRTNELRAAMRAIEEEGDENDTIIELVSANILGEAAKEELHKIDREPFVYVIARTLLRMERHRIAKESYQSGDFSINEEGSPLGTDVSAPSGAVPRSSTTTSATTSKSASPLTSTNQRSTSGPAFDDGSTVSDDDENTPMVYLEECEEVAVQLFQHINYDSRRYIGWSDFTEFLIEEAEQATQNRATAGQFDRYVIRDALQDHSTLAEDEEPIATLPANPKRVIKVQQSKFIIVVCRESTVLCLPEKMEALHKLDTLAAIDAVYIAPPSRSNTNIDTHAHRNGTFDSMYRGNPAIITAGTDLHLQVFDFGPRSISHFNLPRIKSLRCESSIMKMFLAGDRLFLGDRDGNIILVDVSTITSPKVTKIDSARMGCIKPHNKAITALQMVTTQTLVTAALDGKVCTLDLSSLTITHSFFAHEGGVATLALSQKHGFLLTQGFSRTTKVWVGFAGVNHFLLFDGTNPHLHDIVAVETVDALHQIITTDSSGHVKVWNLGNNQPLFDTYIVEKGSLSSRAGVDLSVSPVQQLVYIQRLLRFITVGHRSCTIADFVPGKSVLRAHEEPIRSCAVSPNAGACLTATNNAGKLWSVTKGGLLRGFTVDSFDGEITAIAIEPKGTKLYCALSRGTISVQRLDSGRRLKTFSRIPIQLAEEEDANGGQSSKWHIRGGKYCAPRKKLPFGAKGSDKKQQHDHNAHAMKHIDVIGMCYFAQEDKSKELCCVYSDGRIRFYSDMGTSRLPSRVIDSAFDEKKERLKVLEKAMKARLAEAHRSPPKQREDPPQRGQEDKGSWRSRKNRKLSPGSSPDRSETTTPQPTPPQHRKTSPQQDETEALRQHAPSPQVAQEVDAVAADDRSTIVMCAFSTAVRLMAVVTAAGKIRCIDFLSSTGAPLHEFTVPGDVTAISFLGNYPCLIIGDSTGGVAFCLLRPAALLAFGDTGTWSSRIDHGVTPISFAYDGSNGSLIVGDTHGVATTYDVRGFLFEASLVPITDASTIDEEFQNQKRLKEAYTTMMHSSFVKGADMVKTDDFFLSVTSFANATTLRRNSQLVDGESPLPSAKKAGAKKGHRKAPTQQQQPRMLGEGIGAMSFLTTAMMEHEGDLEAAGVANRGLQEGRSIITELNQMEKSSRNLGSRSKEVITKASSKEVSQGQVSHLHTLNTGHIVVADLNGSANVWAPNFEDKLMTLNPSSILPEEVAGVREPTATMLEQQHESNMKAYHTMQKKLEARRVAAMEEELKQFVGIGDPASPSSSPRRLPQPLDFKAFVESNSTTTSLNVSEKPLPIDGGGSAANLEESIELPETESVVIEPSPKLGDAKPPIKKRGRSLRFLDTNGEETDPLSPAQPLESTSHSVSFGDESSASLASALRRSGSPKKARTRRGVSVRVLSMEELEQREEQKRKSRLFSLHSANEIPEHERKASRYSMISLQTPKWVAPKRKIAKVPLPPKPTSKLEAEAVKTNAHTTKQVAHLSVLQFVEQEEERIKNQMLQDQDAASPARSDGGRRGSPQREDTRQNVRHELVGGYRSLAEVMELEPTTKPSELDALSHEQLHRLKIEEHIAGVVHRHHTCVPRKLTQVEPDASLDHHNEVQNRVIPFSPINGRPMYGLVLPAKEVERVDRAEHRAALGLPQKLNNFQYKKWEF